MVLDDCLSDLEAEGYWNYIDKKGKGRIAPLMVGACSVNAPHRRMRVWIVAHDSKFISRTGETPRREGFKITNGNQDMADGFINSQGTAYRKKSDGKWPDGKQDDGDVVGNDIGDGNQTFRWWSIEPDVGRVAYGVPNRVDRLKSLGNAIVPQVAYQIFKAIKKTEE